MNKQGYVEINEHKQTKRYCQTLDLVADAEKIAEYRKYHQSEHIWDIVPEGLRSIGIYDMEIYILGTRLFMIVETPIDLIGTKHLASWHKCPVRMSGKRLLEHSKKHPKEHHQPRSGK